MNIRLAREYDMAKIKAIHEKFFKDEFEFPNMKPFISTYLVENNGQIVTFGGARVILEAIAVTDLSMKPVDRYDALNMLLSAISLNASEKGFEQLHCFVVKDDTWKKGLVNAGFRETKGTGLVIDL